MRDTMFGSYILYRGDRLPPICFSVGARVMGDVLTEVYRTAEGASQTVPRRLGPISVPLEDC
jgi:hypothetical protein